jgi:hypothetical protein
VVPGIDDVGSVAGEQALATGEIGGEEVAEAGEKAEGVGDEGGLFYLQVGWEGGLLFYCTPAGHRGHGMISCTCSPGGKAKEEEAERVGCEGGFLNLKAREGDSWSSLLHLAHKGSGGCCGLLHLLLWGGGGEEAERVLR